MARSDDGFRLSVTPEMLTPGARLDVIISKRITKKLYDHALESQSHATQPPGFRSHAAPKTYVDDYFGLQLVTQLKEFLLKYAVASFVYKNIREQKIPALGDPRLVDITFEPESGAHYVFQVTAVDPTPIKDWRKLNFRPPARKRYKDIDIQADNFLREEGGSHKTYTDKAITAGDWIFFEATLLDKKKKPLFEQINERLWIRISNEESGLEFRQLFVGHHDGDEFITDCSALSEYFCSQLETNYTYRVIILKVLPRAYFDFELFKEQFKLRSEKKEHQKIVEIYSTRHDLPLRRAIVEEAFTILTKTYPIQVPEAAVLRQEKLLLDALQNNPDYAVYKMQRDFQAKLHQLAHKQMRETSFILLLAAQEKIDADERDVCHYLNLTHRPRTKEFIHFLHPAIRANEDEQPIAHEALKILCVSEKTINHLLHQLEH